MGSTTATTRMTVASGQESDATRSRAASRRSRPVDRKHDTHRRFLLRPVSVRSTGRPVVTPASALRSSRRRQPWVTWRPGQMAFGFVPRAAGARVPAGRSLWPYHTSRSDR